MDEAALIGLARRGDMDAFNRLVLAYQDQLFNQAFRVMGEDAAAEDATQEAFISAYRNLGGFRGGSFRAWLLRIVTNTCYDELRRRKRRPTTPLEPVDDEGEEVESPHWLIDVSALPEDELEREELARAIQHCLNSLPDDFRAAVVSVDIQGLDYAEVSQVLRIPLGTVKSRLARARLRLRDCLRGFWELLPPELRLDVE